MNWPLVRIDTVAEINPRLPKDTDETQEVSFLGMASVSEDGCLLSEEIRVLSETKKGFTYFSKEDVLLAKITPCFENGKCLRPGLIESEIGYGSTEFHVVRARKDRLDSKYLFYMIWSDHFRFNGGNAMSGAAGQKRISADFIKGYEIPLPPLAEQRRIAAILDKADAIRRKRQQAIQLADEFLRAVFLDMFGDPATNPKGWYATTLGDLIHFAKDGPHVSPQYADEGVPFLSTRHVKSAGVVWEDLKYVTREEADFHWQKCKPEYGDILYTKGGTTGIACPVDFDKEFAIWVHIALLRPKAEQVNYIWLAQMLNSKYCYLQSQSHTRGATNKDLGLKRMVDIEVFCPPISEQEKFVEIKSKIDQILDLEVSFDGSELFESLSQRAFTGSL